MKSKKPAVNVEEVIRKQVRKILSEIMPSPSMPSFSGYDFDDSEDGDEDAKPKGHVPGTGKTGRKNLTAKALGGDDLNTIAKEIGTTKEAARQITNKAMETFKKRFMEIPPNELENVILKAVDDYVDLLASSGELEADDVMLLNSHPSIVATMDDFRNDFLPDYMKKLEVKYTAKKVQNRGKSENDF